MVGREYEIKRLKKSLLSDRSELIAVYGRRRIGKTNANYQESLQHHSSFIGEGFNKPHQKFLDLNTLENRHETWVKEKYSRDKLDDFGKPGRNPSLKIQLN